MRGAFTRVVYDPEVFDCFDGSLIRAVRKFRSSGKQRITASRKAKR